MRVLVAFDKFKDCLSASRACAIAADAIRQTDPGSDVDVCPFTDGGDGFGQLLTLAAKGVLQTQVVEGPLGAPVEACFGLVPRSHLPQKAAALLGLGDLEADQRVAVMDMASASGLALLAGKDRDVWHASTHGTGQLLLGAARAGARSILLGVGGSATHDLGLGALAALGCRFLRRDGSPVENPSPAHWDELGSLGPDGPTPLPPVSIACDVTNPFLGPRGAAAVYGPQKGLSADRMGAMEASGQRVAALLCRRFGLPPEAAARPGAGAAGGLSFGLMAAYGAQLVPGSDLVAEWMGLQERIEAADVVVTGEGRFDRSSLEGKGAGSLAARASALGKPVLLLAGSLEGGAHGRGISATAITPPGMPFGQALEQAPTLLAEAVRKAFAPR